MCVCARHVCVRVSCVCVCVCVCVCDSCVQDVCVTVVCKRLVYMCVIVVCAQGYLCSCALQLFTCVLLCIDVNVFKSMICLNYS